MTFDIFISYSAKDKIVADAICARLEASGIRCWIAPRNILPGLDWSEAIVNAIENCSIMVLVFSNNANASPQIKREVERATHKEKIIIPFRIHDIEPSKALEYFISTSHWLDALTPPLEVHIERLTNTVKALLSDQTKSNRDLALREVAPKPAKTGENKSHITPKWFIIGILIAIGLGAGLWIIISGQMKPYYANTKPEVYSTPLKNLSNNQNIPSWNKLIDTARELRQQGKIADSLAAFAKYGEIYGKKYPSAHHYTTVAQSFTAQCRDLGLTGGVYVYRIVKGGVGWSSGLRVGDIIIGYGGHLVFSTKSFIELKLNSDKGKKVKIDLLRMDKNGTFKKLHTLVSTGPLGIYVMDI